MIAVVQVLTGPLALQLGLEGLRLHARCCPLAAHPVIRVFRGSAFRPSYSLAWILLETSKLSPWYRGSLREGVHTERACGLVVEQHQ